MVINYPSPIVQLFMVKFGKHMSFTIRVSLWFSVATVCLVLIPLIQGHFAYTTTYWLTLSIVFLLGIATAVLQATVFGFGGLLPSRYTQAIMSGNGIAGLVVCGLRMLTKVSYKNDPSGIQTSAILYFSICASITFLCVVGYMVLVHLPITKYHVESKRPSPSSRVSNNKQTAKYNQLVDDKLRQLENPSPAAFSIRSFMSNQVGGEYRPELSESGDVSPSISAGGSPPIEEYAIRPMAYDTFDPKGVIHEPRKVSYKKLFKKIQHLVVIIILIFFTTFAVFPGQISNLESSLGVSQDWFTLILIVGALSLLLLPTP